MTSFLNEQKNNKNEDYYVENINGKLTQYIKQYSCCHDNCSEKFAYKEELISHLESHAEY